MTAAATSAATTPLSLSTAAQLNASFEARLQSAIATAQAWDDDPSLLAECRAMIPFELLRDQDEKEETTTTTTTDSYPPYHAPSDRELSPDARFLQRLARFYKESMTWVNQPPCQYCHSTTGTQLQRTRGPETPDERQGQAHCVEVYQCHDCHGGTTTTFPRYNAPRTLLETRQGRCGEYANLFGLYCRALGLETRYILDVTDHVWIEVYVRDAAGDGEDGGGSWMMIDSCEGVIGETSMYEAGWGKQLSYILAASVDHVVDVTPRYTRQFASQDLQRRRRNITSSEEAGQQVIQKVNHMLQQNLSAKAKEELQNRLDAEHNRLKYYQKLTEWDKTYQQGRRSGSLAWKLARNETGTATSAAGPCSNQETSSADVAPTPTQFHVESFYPPASSSTSLPSSKLVSIAVHSKVTSRYDGITVCGTACAMMNLQGTGISIVVVDETYLGCILQSRCFDSLQALADFIAGLPTHRIVAVRGKLAPNELEEQAVAKAKDHTKDSSHESKGDKEENGTTILKPLLRLGGFNSSFLSEGILFLGQVDAQPEWAVCSTFEQAPKGLRIVQSSDPAAVARQANHPPPQLRTEQHARPASIIGRVPDDIMSLRTQEVATGVQKRVAFLHMVEQYSATDRFAGYVTKKGSPIYLLGSASFPLERTVSLAKAANDDADWSTFLLLPPPLVPADVHGMVENDNSDRGNGNTGQPKFEIPLDSLFFERNLGTELLIKKNSGVERTSTVAALKNARLVGLYMSAHWCGRKSLPFCNKGPYERISLIHSPSFTLQPADLSLPCLLKCMNI